MEPSMLTTLLQNPTSTLSFVLVATLFIERLVAGGYLRLWLGKKSTQDKRDDVQDARDVTSDEEGVVSRNVQGELLKGMKELKMHFNHETTEQYDTIIRGQDKILDTLIRIERDGIRIKQ